MSRSYFQIMFEFQLSTVDFSCLGFPELIRPYSIKIPGLNCHIHECVVDNQQWRKSGEFRYFYVFMWIPQSFISDVCGIHCSLLYHAVQEEFWDIWQRWCSSDITWETCWEHKHRHRSLGSLLQSFSSQKWHLMSFWNLSILFWESIIVLTYFAQSIISNLVFQACLFWNAKCIDFSNDNHFSLTSWYLLNWMTIVTSFALKLLLLYFTAVSKYQMMFAIWMFH